MRLILSMIAVLFLTAEAAISAEFCFKAPGVMVPSKAGEGRRGDRTVYLPNLHFPLKAGGDTNLHAYCNSQVYGVGGNLSDKPGDVNSNQNYKYCWSDNFCEARSWKMPMCKSGKGHQGVDCRPNSPARGKYEAVAFADGIVTQVTANTTVTLRAPDGTECRYLHLDAQSILVRRGQQVIGGRTVIGRVSNIMGGIPNTSIHLHFDCSRPMKIGGKSRRAYIPIYTSMVAAYARSWGLPIAVINEQIVSGTRFERP